MGSTKLPPRNPTAYFGIKETNPPQLYFRDRAPTSTDARPYDPGDIWIDNVSDDIYMLIRKARDVGVWQDMGGVPGDVDSLTADVGGAVFSDTADNINIFGTTAQGIDTSGNPGTNTVTITAADATETQKGVLETSTDAESIAGTANDKAVVPSSLASKLGAQTQYAIPYGETTANAFSWVGPLSSGQVVIGDTGNAPAASTLTPGAGIAILNGAGTITISTTGSGLAWVEVVAGAQAMAVATAYGANNAGGVAFTLPVIAGSGTVMEIVGMQGLWSLSQNAGQQVHVGSNSTTIGGAGSLTALDAGDCIVLRCIVANTEWRVQSMIGNLTII